MATLILSFVLSSLSAGALDRPLPYYQPSEPHLRAAQGRCVLETGRIDARNQPLPNRVRCGL